MPRSRTKDLLFLPDSSVQILWHLFKYLTKWRKKLRPSSVPIFVCKHGVPISVATPTRLVAMVTKIGPKLD